MHSLNCSEGSYALLCKDLLCDLLLRKPVQPEQKREPFILLSQGTNHDKSRDKMAAIADRSMTLWKSLM